MDQFNPLSLRRWLQIGAEGRYQSLPLQATPNTTALGFDGRSLLALVMARWLQVTAMSAKAATFIPTC
jgi:hypothetical protein